MDERATLRFSPWRLLGAAALFLPATALAAFMTLIAAVAGGTGALMMLVALLPVAVICAWTTGFYLALGLHAAFRDRIRGYRIRSDDATGTLRDTDGRVVRLDKSQAVRCVGKPPFDVYIFDRTAPAATVGPLPWVAWGARHGFGWFKVLAAQQRGDLVLPLAFIRGRGVFVRLLRRCRFVEP